MIDEISRAFDKPVSVREVLKWNKVDISLMDWMAWSPSTCKELKRLCTRVSKSRQTKPKDLPATNEIPNVPFSAPPNPTFSTFPLTSDVSQQIPMPQQTQPLVNIIPVPQFQGFGATPRGFYTISA